MRRTALFFALLAASTAQAGPLTFGLDSSLNLLAFGNMSVSSSDVEGRVAVGGNATLSGYSINTKSGAAALYPGPGLIVGGNLNFSSGTVWGGAIVGGSYVPQASGNIIGGVTQGQGLAFASEYQRLSTLSATLDALLNTGTAVDQWGTLHFNATGLSLAVFDIQAADASRNMQIDGLLDGAQVLINVHGSSVDFGNHGYTGFNKGQVIFNLPDAANVLLNGGINASLLATQASVGAGWGQINGQVVVKDWNSHVQVNDAPLPPGRPQTPGGTQRLPEPSAISLVALALLAARLSARRRA